MTINCITSQFENKLTALLSAKRTVKTKVLCEISSPALAARLVVTGRRETGEADGKQNKENSSCWRFDETGSEKDEPQFSLTCPPSVTLT